MCFSRHCYTFYSLSSLAQLDSGCVCACSCAGMCIYACQSLKFEAGTMVVMVLRQYFQLMNCEGVRVLLCNKALGTSSSLAVEV